MRKLLVLILLLLDLVAFAQCPEAGDVILVSQQDVDNFVAQYSNCNTISGSLIILSTLATEGSNASTAITSLEDLNFIEEIKEDLTITVDVTTLSNFFKLKIVRGNIEITNSAKLEIIQDFNNLETVKSVVIALNNNLEIIDGFNKIKTINESLELGFGPQLKRIMGFSNLEKIDKEFNFSENPELIEIPTFNKLKSIGDDVNFTSNEKLETINGFENLESINGDFNIEYIKNIRGFSNLKSIGRFFDIRKEVEEIPSFNELVSIGAGFRIENTNISSINGFNKLLKVGESFFLEDWFMLSNNPSLNQVTGFGRFVLVDGNFEVQNNPLMSDCSWMCNLLNNGRITGEVTIKDNPGDCSSAPIIIEICDGDFDDDGIANVIDLDDDNDGILDTIENNGITDLDTDRDGFPNSKDLDSDNDNCFDVLESGFNDADRDGILGSSPVTVNINGIVISDNSGYGIPNDSDNNSIPDFLESNVLNPGENGILTTCLSSASTDLFTILGGNPDPGGTWSPALSSNSSIFDPRIDNPGIYTYTHFNPICGNTSSEVQVIIPSNINSGINANINVCNVSGPINLFSSLGGNPSPNGVWTPELASGTNIFDPNLDDEGIYTYTINSRECGILSSTVNVRITTVPNSGISNKILVCEFSPEFNLFDKLQGEPDTNGTWFPTLPNNTFNPLVHNSGVYTYTVDNGACGVTSSTVEVEVVNNVVLNNVTVNVNDFNNKENTIEVNVFSTREYEYSLDGINYKTENIFRNVKGGKQKVYVRGIDGCEFYEEEIFVKTYPNYFTPNNDGEKDLWQLKDFPDINYKISIYNRLGNLIKVLNSKNEFWNGKFNGKTMQSSNYWFKVETEDGQVLHGNFSLLRK